MTYSIAVSTMTFEQAVVTRVASTAIKANVAIVRVGSFARTFIVRNKYSSVEVAVIAIVVVVVIVIGTIADINPAFIGFISRFLLCLLQVERWCDDVR